MPGKVNPVIPEVVLQVAAQVIGNDTAITIGGMQGQFELNVRIPLIARNLLAVDPPARDHVDRARREVRRRHRGQQGRAASARPSATLAVATALNEHIGYDKATTIVKKASKSGRTLRDVALEEGVDAELYDATIDLRRIAAGSQADAQSDGKPSRSSRFEQRRRDAPPPDSARLGVEPSHHGGRRLRAAAVGEQALLVDPADERDARRLARAPSRPRTSATARSPGGSRRACRSATAGPGRCGCGGRCRCAWKSRPPGAAVGLSVFASAPNSVTASDLARERRVQAPRASRRSSRRRPPGSRAGRRTSPRSSCRRSRRRCGT